ncbi:MAG: MFS transporter [Sphingobium sp.]
MQKTQKGIGFPLLMALLIVAELVCALESSMIYVVLADVYRITGDPVHAGWLLTAFTLTAAGAAAICGRLGDIMGRKKVLVAMLGVALLGSVISATAGNLNLVIVGRAFQGASMAILPLAYGLLREHAAVGKVPLGVGILGGVYAAGSGVGTLLGGVIVDTLHWQGIFVASAALAGAAILLSATLLPVSRARPISGSIDILGGVLFVPAIAMILLGLSFLKMWHWYDLRVVGLLAGGVALLVIWFRHESRLANPLIDVGMLANPRIALPNLGMFAFAIGPISMPLVALPLLQQAPWSGIGFGIGGATAGLIWLAMCIAAAASVILAGYVAVRLGTRAVVLGSLLAIAVGFGGLAAGGYQYLWSAIIILALINPFGGIGYAMIPALIIERSPEDRTSEATGLTQVIRSTAMSIGSLLIPFILTTSMTESGGVRLPGPAAYVLLFIVLSLASLASALFIWKTPKVPTA